LNGSHRLSTARDDSNTYRYHWLSAFVRPKRQTRICREGLANFAWIRGSADHVHHNPRARASTFAPRNCAQAHGIAALVTSADRRDSQEYKLRIAIDKAAGITLADYRVFNHLLNVADFATARLPDPFQPRSLTALADDCHVSMSQVKYSVGHLQRHGWLERHRNITDKGIGGRKHPTRYVLKLGRDCDCKTGQPVAGSRKKGGSECPINRPQEVAISAGQVPVPAGRAVAGGKGGEKPWRDAEGNYLGGPVSWDWDADSYGAEANPR
jgi:hypothetical protein